MKPRPSLLRVVAGNVERLRLKLGLDQVQLARLAHVPCGAVCQIESGDRNLRIHHLHDIAGALGVSPAVLYRT